MYGLVSWDENPLALSHLAELCLCLCKHRKRIQTLFVLTTPTSLLRILFTKVMQDIMIYEFVLSLSVIIRLVNEMCKSVFNLA